MVAGKRASVVRIMVVRPENCSVEFVEPGLCAHPDVAASVLRQSIHGLLGKALLHGYVSETEILCGKSCRCRQDRKTK